MNLAGLITETVIFCGIIFIWSIVEFRSLIEPLWRIGSVSWLLGAPLVAVLTYLIASAFVSGLNRFIGMHEINYLRIFQRSGYGLGLATLMVAVEPAIFEELAFRGIIFDSLRRVIGNNHAIVASAMMFAILHLSIPSFLHLFMMGLVLAWMRSKSGSLYPGMVLHFSHNFLVIVYQQHGFFKW